MSITVAGVPESITRDQLCDLMRSLGLDPSATQSIHVEPQGVTATVFHLDEQGRKVPSGSGGVIKHSIQIRVVDIPVPD